MKNFTTAIIEEKLNQGWTTKQFADYYQMTEIEFLSSLDELSPVKNYIDGIKRRLNKNNKKFRQRNSISEIPTSENKEIESLKNTETTNTSFEEINSIDNLLKRKEELISIIQKSEAFIENTPSYIAHIEEQIEKEKIRHQTYMAGYQEKIDKAISRKNTISQNIKRNSEELENILQKIDSLYNINIRVTENGNIIIENNNISIPKRWQDICFDIMRNDDFKDWDLNDMKIIAKLWSLVNSDLSQKIEISFESEKLKKYFKLLKESKKN